MKSIKFPNESQQYRMARNELLQMEIDLRRQIEKVAATRRELPVGGELKEDYIFTGTDARTVKFSELFEAGKNSLLIYNFMYSPQSEKPCPMCTSILDGLNGEAPHIRDRVSFAVVAKAPIDKISSWAEERNWNHLNLLSSLDNTFNKDYRAETQGEFQQGQQPMLHCFIKKDGKIHHFWSSELFYSSADEGQHMRHVDLQWPLWSMFDLTPEGRGTDWFPQFKY